MHQSRSSTVLANTLLVTWLLSAGAAHAQTTVDINGYNITVNVPIDAPYLAGDRAACWKSKAEKIWNDAFNLDEFKKSSKGCLKLKLNLNIKPSGDAKTTDPKRHNMASSYNAAPKEFPHGGFAGEPGEPQGDNIVAYQKPRDGIFDNIFCDEQKDPDGVRVAHEVGHLMGLGDDYRDVTPTPTAADPHPKRETKPLPGREHTLMADGGPVDMALLRRLVDLIKQATHNVPDCKWQGTLKGHGQGNIYNDSAVVSFSFSEKDDSTIEGNGHVTVTSEKQPFAGYCTVWNTPPDPFDISIVGRRIDDKFHLELPNPRISVVQSGTCRYPNGAVQNRTSSRMTSAFLGAGFGLAFLRPQIAATDGATNELHSTAGDIKVDASIEVHRTDMTPN